MARKYNAITMLAAETAKDITKNEYAWKRYLDTVARIYKLPCRNASSAFIYCFSFGKVRIIIEIYKLFSGVERNEEFYYIHKKVSNKRFFVSVFKIINYYA